MKNQKLNRVQLLKKLHGCASNYYDMDNPHGLLHQLSIAEFEVKSMSELSCDQLQILIDKISNCTIEWKKVEALGVVRIPQMGNRQQYIVKKLQKELGWSDEYMYELTIQRYGFLDWQYITGRSAWSFVNYLIGRSKSKRLQAKKKKELI